MRLSSKHRILWAVLAAGFGASSCWVVAGTGDFTDETSGGSGAAATGGGGTGATGGAGTGASGAMSTGGQGGDPGTGAQGGNPGGAGGDGGQGGSATCPIGSGKPNGACCNDFGECTSTFCVDGFCCNEICAATCMSCSAPGFSPGTCVDACQTVNIGNNTGDQGGTADTYISLSNPDGNHGGGAFFLAESEPGEDRRILIRFDVSAVPPGATIEQATMHLYVVNESLEQCDVYALLEAWDENVQTGGTGIANWNTRTVVGGATPWADPGAGPNGSSAAGALTNFTPSTLDAPIAIGIDPTLVQGWLNTPASNYGLTIRIGGSSGDSAAFLSKEGSTDGQRPYLEIRYISP